MTVPRRFRSGRSCFKSKVLITCRTTANKLCDITSESFCDSKALTLIVPAQHLAITACCGHLAPFVAASDNEDAAAPAKFVFSRKMLPSQSVASMDQVWFAAARQCSLHTSNCSLHQTHQRRKGSGKLLQSKARANHADGSAGEKVPAAVSDLSLLFSSCPFGKWRFRL